jgi:hypothetical protein
MICEISKTQYERIAPYKFPCECYFVHTGYFSQLDDQSVHKFYLS